MGKSLRIYDTHTYHYIHTFGAISLQFFTQSFIQSGAALASVGCNHIPTKDAVDNATKFLRDDVSSSMMFVVVCDTGCLL